MTTRTAAEIKTEVDRMTKERRVGSARFDRSRWTYLMDQLHAEALVEHIRDHGGHCPGCWRDGHTLTCPCAYSDHQVPDLGTLTAYAQRVYGADWQDALGTPVSAPC